MPFPGAFRAFAHSVDSRPVAAAFCSGEDVLFPQRAEFSWTAAT
jgi:hypothetical protein